MQNITQKTIKQPQTLTIKKINYHHNYIQKKQHFNKKIYITHKNTISTHTNQYKIIPNSIKTKNFIIHKLKNKKSFYSYNHNTKQIINHTKTKKLFNIKNQIHTTTHIKYHKNTKIINKIPMAYKNINTIITTQNNLIKIIYTLHQIIYIKK